MPQGLGLRGWSAPPAASALTVDQPPLDQYFLLAGRPGGQDGRGGTGAGDDLTLGPGNTTGSIFIDLSAGNANILQVLQPASLTAAQILIRFGQAGTMGAASRLRGILFDPAVTFSGLVNANPIQLFTYAPTITLDPAAVTTNVNALAGYIAGPTVALGASTLNYGNVQTAGARSKSFFDAANYTAASAGGLAVMNAGHDGIQSQIGEIGLGWTFTALAGLHVYAVVAGLGTITQQVAVDIEDLATYPGTHTNVPLSLRSIGTTIQLRHAGPGVFGANAAISGVSVGLEVQSTTRALLVSRMTTAQKNALTALKGMIVYDTTLDTFEGFQGVGAGAWAAM